MTKLKKIGQFQRAAVDGLTQQWQQAVLLVPAEAGIGQHLCAQHGQAERFIEFSIGQETGIGCDLAADELEFQPAVKTDPQIVLLGVTH